MYCINGIVSLSIQGVIHMTTGKILLALLDAKLYDAFVIQANAYNVDNMSMLLAVATGEVFTHRQILDFMKTI